MHRIKLAVIFINPCGDYHESLLQRPVAGVELFERLVLTLNRSGLDENIVVSHGLRYEEKIKIESRILKDNRFKGKLKWYDRGDFLNENVLEKLGYAEGLHGVLFTSGNIVTTSRHVKDFIRNVLDSKVLERKVVAGMPSNQDGNGRVFIVPGNRLSLINRYVQTQIMEGPVEMIQSAGNRSFCVSVRDNTTARVAEKGLLKQQKSSYTQLMDIWFNSLFSIRISSWLVKTPFTPNQLTLFGIFLGVLTGWFLAQGDYVSGIIGGLILVFSGIWDCCDGDVARLKFMESDYGEYLDTLCDNIINLLTFIGITIGVARQDGIFSSLFPFALLSLGGILIFIFIYYPKGSGKGYSFRETRMYDVILLLASRNFIYVILLFAVLGRLDYFLWLAGIGANIFAVTLFLVKLKVSSVSKINP